MGFRSRCLAASGLAAALLAGLCGCGSAAADVKGATVRGELVMNGKKLKVKEPELIGIYFLQAGGEPEERLLAEAEYNPEDGTFVVKGPTGQGIPEGLYKIEIVYEPSETDGNGIPFESFDAEVTPLMVDVGPGDGQHFIVDLGKQTVTAKN